MVGKAQVYLSELDMRVAAITGLHPTTVRKVTSAFIVEIKRALIEEGSVNLRSFGTLRLIRDKPRIFPTERLGEKWRLVDSLIRIRITVAKSRIFKKEAHDYIKDGKLMEKYAVDEKVRQEEMEKAASEGCPKCGKAVVRHGQVLICPTHGTQPFEQKKVD